MAYSQRSLALASGLLLALLAVRCDSQTFNLLPESGAGAAGQANTGGTGGFNTGGISNTGGNKNIGGQFGGAAFGGGHVGPGTGGSGWDFVPPAGCGRFCGVANCVPCTDNQACGPGGTCLDCANEPSANVGVCVQCLRTDDCRGSQTLCDESTYTCTQPCSKDTHCTFPPRDRCVDGMCVECKYNDDCGSWYCDTSNHACVQCFSDAECKKYAIRTTCDRDRKACVECTDDMHCGSNGRCSDRQCVCSSHEQCQGAPGGPACILEHCQRCGTGLPCPQGETCQFDGKCVRTP